ncbi:MAG: GTP-binding protein [Bowdeniella nasicola]|nr:GTP-binding protein [Bowdeniella nasicola]
MHPTTAALICAIDPVLRSATAFNIATTLPASAAVVFSFSNDGALTYSLMDAHGLRGSEPIELSGECLSCASLEALTMTVLDLAGHYRYLGIFPPLGFDPLPLARTLTEASDHTPLTLATVTSLVDAHTAADDLFGTTRAAERGLAGLGNDLTIAEALMNQIAFADVIITHGPTNAGTEVVEHLQAHDCLLARDIHDDAATRLVFQGHHDPLNAFARIDPCCTQPWGGPSTYGTWTLDLHSDRPFHPARLLDNIELLGAGKLLHRGRFWVPTRPHTLCSWEGAGGQVSVGVVGAMAPGTRHSTRLTIIGQGNERGRLERAFRDSLLTDAEWAYAPSHWRELVSSTGDGLEPWLGDLEPGSGDMEVH